MAVCPPSCARALLTLPSSAPSGTSCSTQGRTRFAMKQPSHHGPITVFARYHWRTAISTSATPGGALHIASVTTVRLSPTITLRGLDASTGAQDHAAAGQAPVATVPLLPGSQAPQQSIPADACRGSHARGIDIALLRQRQTRQRNNGEPSNGFDGERQQTAADGELPTRVKERKPARRTDRRVISSGARPAY